MEKPLEYTLKVNRNPKNDLWLWSIYKTSTGKVVESSKHEFKTKEECRDQAVPYLCDWFAGHNGFYDDE